MKIRFALIGVGMMGRRYAKMLTDGIDGMELSAVVIRSDASLAWFEENIKAGLNIFRSCDELFEHPDTFDAVLIASPHKTHCDLTKRAFELGKYVFCEKPAATTLSETNEMLLAAERSQKKLAVMFQCRTFPVIRKFKELLDSGVIGDLKRVMLENSIYYRTYAYHRSSDWRSTWRGEGGGALINQGQHILDYFIWLFGMPKKVFADVKMGKYTDITVDDEVTMVLDYGNDVSGVFILTTGEIPVREELSAVGTKGKITMSGDRLTVTTYEDSSVYGKTSAENSRGAVSTTTETIDCPEPKSPYTEMLENFRDSIIMGKKLIADGRDGLNVMELTAAAYISGIHKKQVSLPIDPTLWDREVSRLIAAEDSKNV